MNYPISELFEGQPAKLHCGHRGKSVAAAVLDLVERFRFRRLKPSRLPSLKPCSATSARPPGRFGPLGAGFGQLGKFVATSLNYYAAACLYEQLCCLSDAELRQKGLSRDTLAMDIIKACDPSAGE